MLVAEYRIDDPISKRFAVIVLFEKVLFGLILVGLNGNTYAQVSLIMLTKMSFTALIYSKKPLKEAKANKILILNETLVSLALITVLLMYCFGDQAAIKAGQVDALGYICMGFVFIYLGFTIFYSIFAQIMDYYNACKKRD